MMDDRGGGSGWWMIGVVVEGGRGGGGGWWMIRVVVGVVGVDGG